MPTQYRSSQPASLLKNATVRAREKFSPAVVSTIQAKLSNELEYGKMITSSNPVPYYDPLMELLVTLGAEMFVSSRSKSITRSTIMLTYRKVKQMEIVHGPKSIGVHGDSYIYAIFKALGVIKDPQMRKC